MPYILFCILIIFILFFRIKSLPLFTRQKTKFLIFTVNCFSHDNIYYFHNRKTLLPQSHNNFIVTTLRLLKSFNHLHCFSCYIHSNAKIQLVLFKNLYLTRHIKYQLLFKPFLYHEKYFCFLLEGFSGIVIFNIPAFNILSRKWRLK